MKISVIIPIYNVEQYIEECLLSVLNQTLRDIEIICVNDGTPDQSMRIVERYAEKDDRIKIINKENGGLSSARNAGISNAEGEYVYFLDSDDSIKKDMFNDLYSLCSENDLDVVFFGAETLYEDAKAQKKYSRRFEGYYHREHSYENVLSGIDAIKVLIDNNEYRTSACMQLLRRDFILRNKIQFYEGILHEDNLFTYQTITKAQRVMIYDADYYIRRVRNESIMTGKKAVASSWGYFKCMQHIIRELSEFDEETAGYINMLIQTIQRDAVWAIRKYRKEQIENELIGKSSIDKFEYNILICNVLEISSQMSLWNRGMKVIKNIVNRKVR